jgi:hypothetical protein
MANIYAVYADGSFQKFEPCQCCYRRFSKSELFFWTEMFMLTGAEKGEFEGQQIAVNYLFCTVCWDAQYCRYASRLGINVAEEN